jgi:peptidoglycan/xylan/chitin deacetylase (PgdA/CDA1 family)
LYNRATLRAQYILIAIAFALAACSPVSTTEFASQPATVFPTHALTVPPTSEPTATGGPTEPPAPEPESFGSGLRSNIVPVSYIEDQCAYLDARWNPQGALPGTVVAPIMYHSVIEGSGVPLNNQDINRRTFEENIAVAEQLGFETITTEQLLNFLQSNAKIPPRSMIMILDDRKAGVAEEHFLPVLEENDWMLTMAWIAQADTDQRDGLRPDETLWESIERLYATGYLDIQSHGRDHVYITQSTDEDSIRTEIEGSILPLQEHFGVTPIAYVWPGGNYTQLALDVAREAGFELGFTVFSRGPLMFNWIPQGENELVYDDPLLLLPRFWSSAATLNLEQTAAIGDEAQSFAKENYAAEAAWFRQNCGSELPPLENIFK